MGPARNVPAPPSARGVQTRGYAATGGSRSCATMGNGGLSHVYGAVGLRPVNTERAEARGHGGVERCWEWAGIRSRGSATLPLSYTTIQTPRAKGGAGTSRAGVRWGGCGLFGRAGTRPSPSGRMEVESVRKPTSKPLSVSSCLCVLRVNRPEATSQSAHTEKSLFRLRGSVTLPLSYTTVQTPRAEVRWGEYGLFGHAGTRPSPLCRIQPVRTPRAEGGAGTSRARSDGVGTGGGGGYSGGCGPFGRTGARPSHVRSVILP